MIRYLYSVRLFGPWPHRFQDKGEKADPWIPWVLVNPGWIIKWILEFIGIYFMTHPGFTFLPLFQDLVLDFFSSPAVIKGALFYHQMEWNIFDHVVKEYEKKESDSSLFFEILQMCIIPK